MKCNVCNKEAEYVVDGQGVCREHKSKPAIDSAANQQQSGADAMIYGQDKVM